MKRFLIPIAALLVIVFVISGCGKATPTTTAPVITTTAPVVTTSAPVTTTKPAVTTTSAPAVTTTTAPAVTTTTAPAVTTTAAPATVTPVSGGTYRIIAPTGPQVLSYIPNMGPSDSGAVFPIVERLMDATKDRSMGDGLEPVLAESVDTDPVGNTFTFHIRPGVKFHDGSALNADAVIWNFQLVADAGRLSFLNYWKGIKKLDDMTVQVSFTKYNNQLIQAWGWFAIYSKAAWDKASGGDLQKGIEWAKTNCVGTGPFMMKEFKRDDHFYMVKNPNYWRKGQPYMDAIEVRYIPDSMTAQNIFLAGQADEWSGAPIKNQSDLVKQGFTRVSNWAAMPVSIWPNTADAASPWNDKKLRMAAEYAIDKPALAKALGFGYYTPMTMLAPPGEWGFDPNYPARNYDPAKAKQMLADAGYPNGMKTNLLVASDPSSQDAGTAFKSYLDAVGIQTNLDVADPGRFYGAVWGTKPNPGLSVMWSGRDLNYLVTYMRWFSTDPFTNLAYLGHTAEQLALDEAAKAAVTLADQKAAATKIIKYMTDECRIIPIYDTPSAVMVQKYVHTDRYSQGFIRWATENTWMDKH
jgi:peptide/nickel transport system substrate-binding protein